jgi:hypothetical protein
MKAILTVVFSAAIALVMASPTSIAQPLSHGTPPSHQVHLGKPSTGPAALHSKPLALNSPSKPQIAFSNGSWNNYPCKQSAAGYKECFNISVYGNSLLVIDFTQAAYPGGAVTIQPGSTAYHKDFNWLFFVKIPYNSTAGSNSFNFQVYYYALYIGTWVAFDIPYGQLDGTPGWTYGPTSPSCPATDCSWNWSVTTPVPTYESEIAVVLPSIYFTPVLIDNCPDITGEQVIWSVLSYPCSQTPTTPNPNLVTVTGLYKNATFQNNVTLTANFYAAQTTWQSYGTDYHSPEGFSFLVGNNQSLQPFTHENTFGYRGNGTVYPTLDQQAYFLATQSSSSVQISSGTGLGVTNGVGLTEAGAKGNGRTVSSFQYSTHTSSVEVQTSFVATGYSQQYSFLPTGTYIPTEYYTPYQQVIESLSGLPSNASTDLKTSHNSGDNVSLGINNGNNGLLTPEEQLALAFFCAFLPGAAGVACDVAAILAAYYGFIGEFSDSYHSYSTSISNFPSGSGSMNQWAATDNGTWYSCAGNWGTCSGYPSGGYNVFSQGKTFETQIYAGSFGSVTHGQLTVTAMNQWAIAPNGCGSGCSSSVTHSGAQTSLSYGIAPAVSLNGKVVAAIDAGAPAVNGATVTIVQACTSSWGVVLYNDFIVKTNSKGMWHLFANPWCSYSVSATAPGAFGDVGSPTLNLGLLANNPATQVGANYTAANIPLVNYPISVTESGLPSGLSWSATLSQSTSSVTVGPTTNSQIEFYAPNGTFHLAIHSPSGHSSRPSSFSVTIAGAGVTKTTTITEGRPRQRLRWLSRRSPTGGSARPTGHRGLLHEPSSPQSNRTARVANPH